MSAALKYSFKTLIPGMFRSVLIRNGLKLKLTNHLRSEKFPLFLTRGLQHLKVFSGAGFGVFMSGLVMRGGLVAWKQDSSIIAEVDDLYNNQKFPALYDKLKSCLPTTDPEIMWRLVRATYEMSRLPDTKNDVKIQRLEEALRYAEEALKCGPRNCPVHRWYAIALHKLAEAKGTREKIEKAKIVREYMRKAVEFDPESADAHYLLGQWYFSVADITWYERKLANIIYGTPPEATYQEALEQFQQAERAKPGFYSKNTLMLGKALIKVDKKEEGLEILKKLKNFEAKTADDRDAVKEALEILSKHGIK